MKASFPLLYIQTFSMFSVLPCCDNQGYGYPPYFKHKSQYFQVHQISQNDDPIHLKTSNLPKDFLTWSFLLYQYPTSKFLQAVFSTKTDAKRTLQAPKPAVLLHRRERNLFHWNCSYQLLHTWNDFLLLLISFARCFLFSALAFLNLSLHSHYTL